MSALIGHAKAARILGEAFEQEWINADPCDQKTATAAHVARMMARSYRNAADRMEQAMREEATGLSVNCEDGM
jgi:hypothetical protein